LNGNYLSREIFKDGGEVNRSTGTDTFGVLSGLEKTSDMANGKQETTTTGKQETTTTTNGRINGVEVEIEQTLLKN
jgi:hypothetical protein